MQRFYHVFKTVNIYLLPFPTLPTSLSPIPLPTPSHPLPPLLGSVKEILRKLPEIQKSGPRIRNGIRWGGLAFHHFLLSYAACSLIIDLWNVLSFWEVAMLQYYLSYLSQWINNLILLNYYFENNMIYKIIFLIFIAHSSHRICELFRL